MSNASRIVGLVPVLLERLFFILVGYVTSNENDSSVVAKFTSLLRICLHDLRREAQLKASALSSPHTFIMETSFKDQAMVMYPLCL
jgi:hypothetical protein